MNEVIINSNENFVYIDSFMGYNPTTAAHIIEGEESVDIVESWYEEKEDNAVTYGKYNVVNEFLGASHTSKKIKVNEIIRKLCINDLEMLANQEFSSPYDAKSFKEEGIRR